MKRRQFLGLLALGVPAAALGVQQNAVRGPLAWDLGRGPDFTVLTRRLMMVEPLLPPPMEPRWRDLYNEQYVVRAINPPLVEHEVLVTSTDGVHWHGSFVGLDAVRRTVDMVTHGR